MKLEGKSLKSDFLKFVIPSIIAQWVFTIYTMIDGIFVARGVSETALTAVNISFPFVSGMFSVSILFAVGCSTVVAILLGERKVERAHQVFTQNLAVLSIISVVISAVIMLNLESFAKFLGASGNNLVYVKEYIGTLAPFVIAFVLSYSFEILLKTDGYPKKATVIVVLGAVLNCILDFLFVMVFHWGVFGASFATGISQVVVIVFYLQHFLSRKASLKFRRFKMDFKLVWREIKNGIPSGITEFSAGIIVFFFNQAILRYLNEDALVSYTIISYVNSIIVMSMAGIAQGSQPLISYYYGQRNQQKIHRLLRYGMASALIAAVVAGTVCFAGTDAIVSLFVSSDHRELREYSISVFRIFSLSYLIVGFNVVIGGFFTAIERPKAAIAISLARGFVTMLVGLFVMTMLFGGAGIWWSPLVSELATFVLVAALYIRYRKEKQKKRSGE